MKKEQNVSIWFPDVEVLREIKEQAKKERRGMGFVICENWKSKKVGGKENANSD